MLALKYVGVINKDQYSIIKLSIKCIAVLMCVLLFLL